MHYYLGDHDKIALCAKEGFMRAPFLQAIEAAIANIPAQDVDVAKL